MLAESSPYQRLPVRQKPRLLDSPGRWWPSLSMGGSSDPGCTLCMCSPPAVLWVLSCDGVGCTFSCSRRCPSVLVTAVILLSLVCLVALCWTTLALEHWWQCDTWQPSLWLSAAASDRDNGRVGATSSGLNPFPSSASLGVRPCVPLWSGAASPPSPPLLQPRASLHRAVCELHHPGLEHECLPFPSVSSRYYVAANFYNNDAVLIPFIHELQRLLYYLCTPNRFPLHWTASETSASSGGAPPFHASSYPSARTSSCHNIFLSVYESGSSDRSSADLQLLQATLTDLRIHHRIVTNGSITRGKEEDRIRTLTRMRNAAMRPFFDHHTHQRAGQQQALYDHIVFFNVSATLHRHAAPRAAHQHDTARNAAPPCSAYQGAQRSQSRTTPCESLTPRCSHPLRMHCGT